MILQRAQAATVLNSTILHYTMSAVLSGTTQWPKTPNYHLDKVEKDRECLKCVCVEDRRMFVHVVAQIFAIMHADCL